MAFGRCKLTLSSGTFVDSHIIPQAFTRPDPGAHFIEGGEGRRLIRRPSSWYDPKLVTRKGENILSDLDDYAIKSLRNNFIVWSGWGDAAAIPLDPDDLLNGYGIRRISGVDTSKLRLFFLSLMWRAAASNRSELAKVALKSDDLERLRTMIVGGHPEPTEFLPVHLIQHSTIGPRHNLGPLKGSELSDAPDAEAPGILAKAYRFYFDGLVAYVCPDLTVDEYGEAKNLFVGEHDHMLVSCVPFKNSWQENNLKKHIVEAKSDWPDTYNKLVRG